MKLTIVFALAALVVSTAPLQAIAADPEDLANDIASEIMSPFCPGVTLHDCPSDTAAALRERIEGWARQGWTRARIMDALEEEYGADIRAVPPASGSGLLAWVLPGLAIVAGLGVATVVARKWAAGRPAPKESFGSPAERAQIEAELTAMREAPR